MTRPGGPLRRNRGFLVIGVFLCISGHTGPFRSCPLIIGQGEGLGGIGEGKFCFLAIGYNTAINCNTAVRVEGKPVFCFRCFPHVLLGFGQHLFDNILAGGQIFACQLVFRNKVVLIIIRSHRSDFNIGKLIAGVIGPVQINIKCLIGHLIAIVIIGPQAIFHRFCNIYL